MEKEFLKSIKITTEEYFKSGSKTNIRLENITAFFVNYLQKEIDDKDFKVVTEFNVSSFNSTSRKRCDIVILKNNYPYIIFPLKFPMCNFKQNKNNYWENLCGEALQMKTMNKQIKIIPINIIFNSIPYISENKIKKFETITYENSFKIYDDFLNYDKNKVFFNFINYIIDVEHLNKIDEKYENINIISLNKETPFIPFNIVLNRRQNMCSRIGYKMFRFFSFLFFKKI